MQHFVNDVDGLVSRALDGMVAGTPNLRRFPVDSSFDVVVRADWDRDRVAVVSGGGSGHEPAHAGFVGRGMLTAAVCGDVFASPSVDAVLATILAVTGDAGCLLVVKNYTGDRLNFGLAAQRARNLGHDVEVVLVADDIALPDADEPRGLAGTLLVHKVAGHLAEEGEDLAAVAGAARDVAGRVHTIGVARGTAHVPGNDEVDRIPDDQVEVGLGIHGEPGVDTTGFDGSRELVAAMVDRLVRAVGDDGSGDAPLALVVNDLGGTSGLEMASVVADLAETDLWGRTSMLVGPAALMTSLDMPGFSVTCLVLADGDGDALRAPTDALGWPAVVEPGDPGDRVMDAPELPPTALEDMDASDDPQVRRVLETIAGVFVDGEDDLNELDAKVGDGDTGSTFASMGRDLRDRLDDLPLAEPDRLCAAIGALAMDSMGGSSGVLVAILCEAVAERVADGSWADALAYGLEAMQHHGGAEPGDRTMVDALGPAIEALQAGDGVDGAATAAREGANATAEMDQASAGRSSYLSDDALEGVTDPGAEVVARVFEALAAD